MTSYLLAGPAAEPVTLGEAKAFLRVDGADEDAFISTLITAARLHVEGTTARALLAQSWRMLLDCWPVSREVRLPVGPLISLTSVTAYDPANVAAVLPLGQFQTETNVVPAYVFLPPIVDGMPVTRDRNSIEIDYVAGYGADAADVPADLKQAVLVLAGYWFENRDAVATGAMTPAGFDKLIGKYRAVRI